MDCPKCGVDVPKQWKNKRRQLVGKCPGCGKLVSFGKAPKEQSNDNGGTQTPTTETPQTEKKEISQGERRTRKAPAPSRRNQQLEPVNTPKHITGWGGFGAKFIEWLNTEL